MKISIKIFNSDFVFLNLFYFYYNVYVNIQYISILSTYLHIVIFDTIYYLIYIYFLYTYGVILRIVVDTIIQVTVM